MIISSHITGQLHTMLEPHIQKGGVYVDATAGGGRDTLFLASHVGAAGKIYAFDRESACTDESKTVNP
ncbi:MAG: hypothetical protein ACLTXL_11125 [Clostridia bacterium]